MISFPSGTEMFHFPEYRSIYLFIQYKVTTLRMAGFPHSEIAGSKCTCHSPTLIAAYHVLHRLPVPRHPSYALSSLTTKIIFRRPNTLLVLQHKDLLLSEQTSIPDTKKTYAIIKDRYPLPKEKTGGRTWTRTRDLILIRDAL